MVTIPALEEPPALAKANVLDSHLARITVTIPRLATFRPTTNS